MGVPRDRGEEACDAFYHAQLCTLEASTSSTLTRDGHQHDGNDKGAEHGSSLVGIVL